MPGPVQDVILQQRPEWADHEVVAAELAAVVNPECAAQVLFMFGQGGYRPGEFMTRLYAAMSAADPDNLAKLVDAFPDQGLAFSIAQFVREGTTVLAAAVGGGS